MSAFGDFTNRGFEKAGFGGYKISDVDSFMVELANARSQADRETADLKRRLEAAEKKIQSYEKEEDSLKNTLISAQRLADKIVAEAQEKADFTIQDAKSKADIMTQNEKIKADGLIDCAQREVEMRKNEADRIKREVSDFKLSVMRLYKAQLELINDIPSEDLPPFDEAAAQREPDAETDTRVPETEVRDDAEMPQNPVDQSFDEACAAEALNETDAGDNAAERKSQKVPEQGNQKVPEQGKRKIPEREPQVPQSTSQSEDEHTEDEEADSKSAKVQTVKLNLRYNEKTGEYEPIGVRHGGDDTADFIEQDGKNGNGIKFGADYNIRTDSFDDGTGRHGSRHK